MALDGSGLAVEPNELGLGRWVRHALEQETRESVQKALNRPRRPANPDPDRLVTPWLTPGARLVAVSGGEGRTWSGDAATDFTLYGIAGQQVVVEAKSFKGLRRHFKETDEREAFVEERFQLDQDRQNITVLTAGYLRTLIARSSEVWTEAARRVHEPCTTPSTGESRDVVLFMGCGTGKTATFMSLWQHLESVHNRVVVSRDADASTVIHVARDETEALRLKTYKLAAVKRLGMVLRACLSRLHSLVHAADRLQAPPGRLVTSSPQHTRGPNIQRTTASTVVRGMSLAHA